MKYLSILCLAAIVIANAQTTEKEMLANPAYTASGYLVYPNPEQSKDKAIFTKAPAGYKPFYISHYGRHGSRYHYSGADYEYLYNTLAKADSADALTELGKSALQRTRYLAKTATPRKGDLTQKGVAQHEGIARRMYRNFPEVFKGKAPHVDAYASTSGRCIVSMSAFLGELRANNPKIKVTEEVSGSLMYLINNFDFNNDSAKATDEWNAQTAKLWEHIDFQPLMKKLFRDSAYVAKNVDASAFYNKLYEIHSSLQNLDEDFFDFTFDFSDLFTKEELYARWLAQNAYWYGLFGAGASNGYAINSAKQILLNIIVEADRAIYCDSIKCITPTAATLRFGHDTGILPLAVLMQLSIANAKVTDATKLHEQWTDFKLIPMAANLQIVFYKSTKKGAPILVKFLYNEREVLLPIPCSITSRGIDCPYYKWEDVKAFYLNIPGVKAANISQK